MPEIRTVETTRRPVLQHEHLQRPPMTLRTVPPLEGLNHQKAGAVWGSCEGRHTGFIPLRAGPGNYPTVVRRAALSIATTPQYRPPTA
ncbi:hypothetical protein GCM10022233_16080 [Streptomyces shaanxiensis]|uniref:Uncharacterized protein n=1 Tax=Streptomyces shaanxiensis TaxID=653357 RepID=A0ABP7ULN4_9ACTN